jgi:Na+/H+ antiporter NhaC
LPKIGFGKKLNQIELKGDAQMRNENRVEFFFSNNLSVLPFGIFVVAILVMGLLKGFSLQAFVAFAVVGLIVGTFFAKDWEKYWDCVVTGIIDKSTGLIASIFLLAGLFSAIMAHGRVAEGLVWLGQITNLHGGPFVGFTFLASLLFGLATGTSVGTVITMTPIFYPAGLLLGANPVLLLGAILSGAAFGDNLAPVSDTTIISASSQKYKNREGSASIGGVVRTRTKYSVIAAAISLVLYVVLGGIGSITVSGTASIAEFSYLKGLLMLIPFVVVLVIALYGKSIYTALIWGIITGSVVGLISGILTPGSFVRLENGNVVGLIPEGIGGVFGVIIIYVAIMGMMGVIKGSGALDRMLAWATEHLAKSPRSCEATIFGLTTIMELLNAGVTTSVVAIMGPIANELGQKFSLHPYRRANLVDAVGNTWAYFIPWSAFLFIVISIVESMKSTYSFLVTPTPNQFFFAVFHAWFLWLVMLFTVVTGYGREFEGKNGEEIPANFKNQMPTELADRERSSI